MPYTGNLSSSESSLSNSSSVSCISHARRFSMMRSCSSSREWARHSYIYGASKPKRPALESPAFCGKTPEHFDNGHIAGYVLPLQLWNPYTHVIDLAELRIRCNFPDKSPLATGENGTKAIPFPTQKGMTSFSEVRSTIE